MKLPAFFRLSAPAARLRARLAAPVNDLLNLFAVRPRLVQALVALLFVVGSQSDAHAGAFADSGLQSSMGVLSAIIMIFAYAMALVLVVSAGFAWKRGDEYWLHLIGAVVMALAPSLTNFIFSANGLSNAAITNTAINDAMAK